MLVIHSSSVFNETKHLIDTIDVKNQASDFYYME